jgi:hypothetical protein
MHLFGPGFQVTVIQFIRIRIDLGVQTKCGRPECCSPVDIVGLTVDDESGKLTLVHYWDLRNFFFPGDSRAIFRHPDIFRNISVATLVVQESLLPIHSLLALPTNNEHSLCELQPKRGAPDPTLSKFCKGSQRNEDRFMGWMLGYSQKADLHQAHISVLFSSQSARSGPSEGPYMIQQFMPKQCMKYRRIVKTQD